MMLMGSPLVVAAAKQRLQSLTVLVHAVQLRVYVLLMLCRYARTGKESRKEFEQFTRSYFTQRTTLVMVLLLVDCRCGQGREGIGAGELALPRRPFACSHLQCYVGQQKQPLISLSYPYLLLQVS